MKHFAKLLALTYTTSAWAVTLVVPNTHALVEADHNNGLPFSYGGTALHYQQVYDASQFAVLQPGGGTIGSIGFRYHQRNNEVTIQYEITVKLATTARAVNDLSTNLTSNLGTDNKTVFSSSSFYVSPPAEVGTPWPFPITIPFNSGFFYNPTNGNLLVDIQIWQYYTWYGGPLLDTVATPDDSVSRVARDSSGWYGSTPDTYGAVTDFSVVPVVPLKPRVTATVRLDDNFIVQGEGGAPGLVYCVLETGDLSQQITSWTCVATNAFDSLGRFVFTNAMSQATGHKFYSIQVQ